VVVIFVSSVPFVEHILPYYVLYIKAISRYIVHKYSAQHGPYGRSILMVFVRVSSYYLYIAVFRTYSCSGITSLFLYFVHNILMSLKGGIFLCSSYYLDRGIRDRNVCEIHNVDSYSTRNRKECVRNTYYFGWLLAFGDILRCPLPHFRYIRPQIGYISAHISPILRP